MKSKAHMKAAALFAKRKEKDDKVKAADKKLIEERDKAREKRLAKMDRLKALRLAKEAAEKETAADADETSSARGLSAAHQRRS